MTKLIFDTESDDLLYGATVIHCISCKDKDTGKVQSFPPDSIQEAIGVLSGAKMLIGHNIAQFDIPLIEKLYGVNLFKHCTVRDTYCMSKLFYPERTQTVGHSLDSYGKQLGRFKPVHEDWSKFSPEMLYRNVEDVEINYLLYDLLVKHNCMSWDWVEALELEQLFAYYQGWQEVEGVDIDVDLCHKIVTDIDKEVEELDAILKPTLPKRIKAKGNPIMKPFKKDGSYMSKVVEWWS